MLTITMSTQLKSWPDFRPDKFQGFYFLDSTKRFQVAQAKPHQRQCLDQLASE